MRRTYAAGMLFALASGVAGCSSSATEVDCRRVEGASLVPERRFVAVIENAGGSWLSKAPERIEVAVLYSRRTQNPVELVHVLGDREIGRWPLRANGPGPVTNCSIGTNNATSSCGATLGELPHPMEGYYYLHVDDDNVLEAGLAFVLCRDSGKGTGGS